MQKFFELPIFKMSGKEPLQELKLISQNYKAYIERIKRKVVLNTQLKKKTEENLVCINNMISTKYVQYEKIKNKVEIINSEINQKFYEIR